MMGESTYIYHKIVIYALTTQYSFEKIKKYFGLWSPKSKVSTLTLADASGITVWLINTKTHKIDASTFNPFIRVQVEYKLGKSPFICKKKFLVANTSRKGWLFGLFDATSALQGGLTPRVIY